MTHGKSGRAFLVPRITTLAAALACVPAGAATAAAVAEWGFVQAGTDDVRLFYGFPESEDVTLSIICHPRRKQLVIAVFALPRGAKAGQRVRVTLRAGGKNTAHNGKVVRDRVHGGIYVAAPARADTRIFEPLRASGTLTVAAGSKRETVPLKNVAEPLAKMKKACLGR
jgi:hypothetical protein